MMASLIVINGHIYILVLQLKSASPVLLPPPRKSIIYHNLLLSISSLILSNSLQYESVQNFR